MRLAPLIVCALVLELGWLAMWPLSTALSHSAQFTTSLLETHAFIEPILQATSRLVPGLATTTLSDALGSPAYTAPATVLASLMLALAGAYGLSLLLLDRGLGKQRGAPAVIFVATVVFQVTLLYLPGIFSQDVFGYIAYGRLSAVYELNPYIWPPSVLRDPVVGWVADVWRTYATPYGPAWVGLQWLLARTSDSLSIADQALVYRGLASALLLGNLALAWRLLGRLTPLSFAQRTTSLAALAWNPLLLFEVAGNAHNDILMVSFSFLALLLFRTSSRGLLSSLALTFGALVKYLSGIGLIWLALASAARVHGWRHRAARVAALALISIVISLAVAGPWLELPDSLDPLLNETAGVGYVNSLPDTIVVMFVDRFGAPLDPARNLERLLCLAAFGLYLAWEARQVWADPSRAAVARGLARSCLVYVLVASTSLQTWYFCVPLSIALALGWRRRIARLTLAYSALALPALYLSYYLRDSTPAWVFLVYACAPLLVLVPDAIAARRGLRVTTVVTHPDERAAPQPSATPVMERASR
jgi:hypothetical protein